ncbi:hypothetical protein ACHAW6_003550 [Cyclotella cf. meneghiniana]
MEGHLPTHPTDVHRAYAAKRAIRTFKAHFLSILAGIDTNFPNYLWDKLLPQAELTLNLLCQSTIAPAVSAWEYFHGPFNFDATPLGPIGCRVIIHNKVTTQNPWDFCGRTGFNIGPALQHYCCFQVVDTATNVLIISDNIKLQHEYLCQPSLSYEDGLLPAINFLWSALADAPADAINAQLQAINSLCTLFNNWTTDPSSEPPTPPLLQMLSQPPAQTSSPSSGPRMKQPSPP